MPKMGIMPQYYIEDDHEARTGRFTGIGTFTIVEVKDGQGSKFGLGKLKSGAGWISLDYAKRV